MSYANYQEYVKLSFESRNYFLFHFESEVGIS